MFIPPSTSEDGTVLGPPVTLDLQGHSILYSGISVAAPRCGNRFMDWVEAAFPSGTDGNEWVYLKLRLR